jgi:hypothetical protein
LPDPSCSGRSPRGCVDLRSRWADCALPNRSCSRIALRHCRGRRHRRSRARGSPPPAPRGATASRALPRRSAPSSMPPEPTAVRQWPTARDGRLGAVPPPDLEVERRRIRRPGEVRRVQQPRRTVDARARGSSRRDSGQECADDHRAGRRFGGRRRRRASRRRSAPVVATRARAHADARDQMSVQPAAPSTPSARRERSDRSEGLRGRSPVRLA